MGGGEFLIRDDLPPALGHRLSEIVLDILRQRSTSLAVDAVVDPPYQGQFDDILSELTQRAEDRHRRQRDMSVWYRLTRRTPSLLSIELPIDEPRNFDLFKRFAFYSIHAEVKGRNGSTEGTPIFASDDSGQSVWFSLTANEAVSLQERLAEESWKFDDCLEPYSRPN